MTASADRWASSGQEGEYRAGAGSSCATSPATTAGAASPAASVGFELAAGSDAARAALSALKKCDTPGRAPVASVATVVFCFFPGAADRSSSSPGAGALTRAVVDVFFVGDGSPADREDVLQDDESLLSWCSRGDGRGRPRKEASEKTRSGTADEQGPVSWEELQGEATSAEDAPPRTRSFWGTTLEEATPLLKTPGRAPSLRRSCRAKSTGQSQPSASSVEGHGMKEDDAPSAGRRRRWSP